MILISKIGKHITAICLIVFLVGSGLYPQNIIFNNLSVKDGLSNDKVISVLQDKAGFLWFATEDGLNRFDGYEFKVFRNDPDDSNSISGNNIWSIFEDGDGNIWIGTKDGVLNRYDVHKEIFEHWKIKSQFVKENSINEIYRDKEGFVWIGSYQSGLYRLDLKNNKIDNWYYKPGSKTCLTNNFVTFITEDQYGYIWISTYKGLNKFDPKSGGDSFQQFYADPQNENSLSNNLIWSISSSEFNPDVLWLGTANGVVSLNVKENSFKRIPVPTEKNLQFGSSAASVIEEKHNNQNILWLATYAGLVRLNLNTGASQRYVKKENDQTSIISNQINRLIRDRSGVLWAATENGISYISPKSMQFNNSFGAGNNLNGLTDVLKADVRCITQNSDGTIFIGTSRGLKIFNSSEQPGTSNTYKNNNVLNVWSLAVGSSGNLWIGTYGQGLKQLNLKNGTVKNRTIESPTFKTSAFDYLKTLFPDDNNNLWIGFWGGGLAKFNTETGGYQIWISESGNPNSISYNDVWALQKDRKGRLWIGTNGGGLNLFEDSHGGTFHRWIELYDKSKQLNSNSVYSICEGVNEKDHNTDGNTVLWVGTGGGLNKVIIKNSSDLYNPDSSDVSVTGYNNQNGLADNAVKSILEDSNGNLWLGTNAGISFFDTGHEHFINYSNYDGVIGNEFNSGSAFRSKDGLMYFGSVEGLNVFDPRQIKQSSFVPPLVITEFEIFNQPVPVGPNSVLKQSIQETRKIELSYSQNVFSFQFSALDYNSPGSIQYAYMMEGFDDDWIYSVNRRFITYTNLNSGTYTFKVKATNSDGVWSRDVKSVTIIVDQPWWRTGWAYTAYIFLIAVGIFSARRIEINRTRLRNELKMREFEAKKQSELDTMKARFFANLSHEFKTPLTLIKGPVDELISGAAKENQQEYFELIKRNSEKLQELIEQLLELTQLENAAIPLKAKKENLVDLLRGIVSSFDSLARQKNITLSLESPDDKILCWIDRDKMEKILNNLLSNAFKFTGSGGSIKVQSEIQNSNEEDFALVKISDTGIGIPKYKLDKIFDRFYQVDDSVRKNYVGSGIGLALVKELVDLHNWEIEVTSEQGRGTAFYLYIPLQETYLDETQKDAEVVSEKLSETEVGGKEINQIEKELEREILEKNKLLGDRPVVLIVEDSADVRIFLKSILQSEYALTEAVDGEDGLRKAAENIPSLIISDVMMPSMDGIEFCRRIKTDLLTSHIPVILLTAKASQESRIEGLETGADGYLTKPFNSKELLIRVKNLLEQRTKLREKFSKEVKIETSSITVTSLDDEFLQKALNVAENNLSDTEFSSQDFAKEMFMSRSQLHRKLVSVTGQGPGEFLRTFRLKRAAALILEKRMSVTQIAFEVGFSSPSHFSKAFRQLFNCLPTDFTRKTAL